MDTTFIDANILIVDDKETNIDVLAGLLEFQGYKNIQSTTDPRLVVDLFNTFHPDLILLDLMMPYLTGFEVLDQLKELISPQAYLPVLVLTADISVETKQRALSAGAKDFLAKPFDLIEVGLRIENLLFARHLYQTLQNQNQVLEEKVRERTISLEKLNEELEQRVIQRTSQLKRANQELEAFSYSVSHDLRAPLRHIKGYIDLLMDLNTNQRSEDEIHYLKVIVGGASEMEKLIDALLSFSKLNSAELRKTHIDSMAMIKQVIKLLEPETQNRNITFHLGQIHDCEGDEQLLKQVWINLISNAIKYTGKKEEAIIEIGSVRNDEEIDFFVKDNGAGFDNKYAGKLFTVFKRLHKPGDFNGIGIGLAIVNSIVTRHGGRCSGNGEVGMGATFRFYLPV